jgi:hypothetical protein
MLKRGLRENGSLGLTVMALMADLLPPPQRRSLQRGLHRPTASCGRWCCLPLAEK